MKPYGFNELKRETNNFAFPDAADVRNYGRKSFFGKSKSIGKRISRRFIKRLARIEGKNQILKELN